MSLKTHCGIDAHVGNTPLIRLKAISEMTGCEILGKAEFLNPGGSIKDRTALNIIKVAEAEGRLKRGDTIVEGTAGNTGIGLTILGRARGYRTVIVIPETVSPEKITLLRTLGAKVVLTPDSNETDPENFINLAQRLSLEHGWFWANQFDNLANRAAHYRTTGPEIWQQTAGEISAFVSVVGTGGTLAGTALYLKEKNPNITVICADPHGAAMWSWFTNRKVEASPGSSEMEGVGQTRVTKNLEGIKVDAAFRISDQEAVSVVHQLLREEGLFLGMSSGINVAGAFEFAKQQGPGQTIVTILSDSGHKYQSKLYNPAWLQSKGLTPGT